MVVQLFNFKISLVLYNSGESIIIVQDFTISVYTAVQVIISSLGLHLAHFLSTYWHTIIPWVHQEVDLERKEASMGMNKR